MQEQEGEAEEIEREERGGAFFKGIINSLNVVESTDYLCATTAKLPPY